jgi:hypothetical protein
MNKPSISYHVLNIDNTYTKQKSVYAGTYTGDESLTVSLRIWNNFRGIEDVEDLQNFNIVLRFLTEEDNALLKYFKVITETNTSQDIIDPVLEKDTAVFRFPTTVVLSGQANTGSDEYVSNYINITILFDPGANSYLKDHDLKSLIVEIVEL